MTVHTWVGKPPTGYEAEIVKSLHTGLAAEKEHFTLYANLLVNRREIDLLVVKPNGMFLVEHKWCEASIVGGMNGTWIATTADGKERHVNGGRENPYQQVLFNFYALSTWLENERRHFLEPGRATRQHFRPVPGTSDVRPMRIQSLVAISPELQPESRLVLDSRVNVIGVSSLLDRIRTGSTPNVRLSAEEATGIARELWLSPWTPDEVLAAPAVSIPTNAAEVVRNRLSGSTKAMEAPTPSVALRECWDYLRWVLSKRFPPRRTGVGGSANRATALK